MRRLGYQVDACRGGEQAWRLFEAHPDAYALVLADITMPEMSGQEMLGRMLERNPGICILICSGYPFDTATIPAPNPAQVGFLQKPFSPRMLAGAVEQLLAGRSR